LASRQLPSDDGHLIADYFLRYRQQVVVMGQEQYLSHARQPSEGLKLSLGAQS
jgi:hypothetical protein